jgi:L-cystine uptake protein TcyP (sodium:dicarboxylate symporter family)
MVSTDKPMAIKQITKLNTSTVNKTAYAKAIGGSVSKKVTVPYNLQASPVAVKSTVNAVTKQLTQAQKDAINAAYNRKMGISIIKSDAFQKVSGIVKAKVISVMRVWRLTQGAQGRYYTQHKNKQQQTGMPSICYLLNNKNGVLCKLIISHG